MATVSTQQEQSGYEKIVEAFSIFLRYPGYDERVSADNYELYAGPDPEVVEERDVKRLKELGWEADESYACFRFMI